MTFSKWRAHHSAKKRGASAMAASKATKGVTMSGLG